MASTSALKPLFDSAEHDEQLALDVTQNEDHGQGIPLVHVPRTGHVKYGNDDRHGDMTSDDQEIYGLMGESRRRQSHDNDDDEEDEEILGLMSEARQRRSQDDEAKEQSTPEQPLFRDEDLDIDSAAAMVRRIVPESDDPTLPTLTFRVFLLGTLLCVLGASVSQLFFFRSNAPSFSTFFVILLAHPLGHALTHILPESLSSGPFNKKEHLLIGVLAGSGASAAYAGEIISVQSLYYKNDLGTIGGLLLLLSSQLIGFGFSGLTYRLLVRPTSMLWPSTLVFVQLFETLHGAAKESKKEAKTRMRFFKYSFLGSLGWQFVPSVIFPTLSSIAVLCLINNRSLIMRTLGSGFDGYGFLVFSFDWTVISATGPLFTPWFAQVSYLAGMAFNMWVVAPLLYFSNFWDARSYDSPLAAHLYNSTYGRLDVLEILNPDLSLNETRFAEVGPIRLTPYFALSYFVSFAILTSACVSVVLWNWKDIKMAFSTRQVAGDIHCEMLDRSYAPVPNSYYLAIFSSMFLAATWLVVAFPLQLPVWGLCLSILVALAFLPALGIIAAATGSTLGLNVITEAIAGWLFPGRPLANIVFKVYGYMALVQSIDLTSDMKLGLYCKIPPRHLFISQVYGTALGSIVNFSLIKGVIASKRPYLDGTIVDPTGQWSGRKPEIFMSASVIWGLVAPARFFSGLYHPLYWGFLVGAILPVIPWVIYKRTGTTFWRKVSVPLILHGAIGPPQIPTNIIIPGFLASFASQFWALRYHPRWFDRYCFVLSAALDAGTSINALVIYLFSLSFPFWWGNSSIDTEHCIPGS